MKVLIALMLFLFSPTHVLAELDNSLSENRKQYGKEVATREYTGDDRSFNGKKVYRLPLFGWQVEAIYKDGRSFSESARPKGQEVRKKIITEQEANVISDMLYPKKDRGSYKKQIKNANFISHFFDNGVVSYEMQLDGRKKFHIGIVGVRTVLYSNGEKFKDIKVNAYQ